MTTLYQGRRWDAPLADDAELADLTGTCAWCDEPVTEKDDAMRLGSMGHTECILRSGLGDVAHLERRCLCFGGSSHDEEGTYREQSRRVVEWLVAHGRGRWRAELHDVAAHVAAGGFGVTAPGCPACKDGYQRLPRQSMPR